MPSKSFANFAKSFLRRRFNGLAGLGNRLEYKAYLRLVETLTSCGLSHLLLGQPFSAEEHPHLVSNLNLLHPAETVDLNAEGRPYTEDRFLSCCQDIVEGRLRRASIFTCEIPGARFSPQNGLVFDARWCPVVESILDFQRFYTFRKTFRPSKVTRRYGTFSSIQHPWHYNNWHWTADSLPQIHSLQMHMKGQPLILLISSSVSQVHRDALHALLPANFAVEYVSPRVWFEVETFILPSFVSSRANAFFPQAYFDFIRSTTVSNLGLDRPANPTRRLYISRNRARHRRLLNEPQTVKLLAAFGFERIFMEDYTFADQVSLMLNSEAIVAPHGAALGSIVYGNSLKVCVLYPEARPAGYFYTLATGAGHRHFCTKSDVSEHDNFTVDLDALRLILTHEMGLEPRPAIIGEWVTRSSATPASAYSQAR